MMRSRVVTNIRMDREDWVMIKSMAADKNMSFNEYMNWLARDSVVKFTLGEEICRVGGKRNLDLKNLIRDAERVKSRPEAAFSEDDVIVYGGDRK